MTDRPDAGPGADAALAGSCTTSLDSSAEPARRCADTGYGSLLTLREYHGVLQFDEAVAKEMSYLS